MCDKEVDVIDEDGKLLSPDEVTRRISSLKEMMLAESKLKDVRTDDEYMLRFLYCTSFNVSKAIKRLKDNFENLLQYPEMFASCGPLAKKEIIEHNAKVMLEERDKMGRRIYVFKSGKIDTNKSSVPDEMQIDEIWIESVMTDISTHLHGICVIMDLKDYSWKLFKWLTLYNIKAFCRKMDTFPITDAVVHVVNTSYLMNVSIKLVWPFLSERLKRMAKFHFNNVSALHEYISPEILPPEYEGTGPEIDYDKLKQSLYDRDAEIGQRLLHQHILKSKVDF